MHPPQLADPLHTEGMPWVPTGGGKAFRPLRFEADGWSELMHLEPGSVVPLHRHTGEVHAYNLSGSGRSSAPGRSSGRVTSFTPPGNVDAWQAVGNEPCVVHIKVTGAVEYLDEAGAVTGQADSASQRAAYLDWCRETGSEPACRLA